MMDGGGRLGIKGLVDWSYLGRQGSWMGIKQVGVILSGLLISMAFARMAAPILYGQYQYVVAVIKLLAVFSLNGLNFVVIKSVLAGDEKAMVRAARLSLRVGLFAVPMMLGVAIWKYNAGEIYVAAALAVAAVLMPVMFATNQWVPYFTARKDFRRVAAGTLALQGLLVVCLGGVLAMGRGIIWLVAMYGLVHVIVNWWWYRTAKGMIRSDGDYLDVRHGLLVTINKFTTAMTGSIPVILIAWLYGYEQAALFGIALFIMTMATSVSVTLFSIYVPHIIDIKNIRRWIVGKWQLISLLGVGVTLFLYIGIKLFFFLIYGETYAVSYEIVMAVLPVSVLFSWRAFLLIFLTASNKNIFLMTVDVMAHAVGLGVLIVGRSGYEFAVVAAVYYMIIVGGPILLMLAKMWRMMRQQTADA